jgi:uncharacterized membrane protein
VSAQRPSHSVFIGGEQLPLEARMGGIFLGFLCAVILIRVLGRQRAGLPPSGLVGLACWLLIALTGLDGLNAFFFDGSLPHLYPPSTIVRLLTGLGAGLGVGLMAVPVVARVVWSPSTDEHSVEDLVELGSGVLLAALVGGLVLAGVGALLWPVALAMVVSVVVAFGVANLYLLVLASGRVGQVEASGALSGLLFSSFGLVLLELGGLAALRVWLAATFGLTWAV